MTKHLAIIAGKGRMPLEVAHAAADDGYRLLVMPINGQADADFTGLRPFQSGLVLLLLTGSFAAGSRDRPASFWLARLSGHHYAIYGLTRMGSNCLVRCLPEVMIRFCGCSRIIFAAQGIAIMGVERFLCRHDS